MRNIFLGAYAAAPPEAAAIGREGRGVSEADENAYFSGVQQLIEEGLANGWEIPYHAHPIEGFHARGTRWIKTFLRNQAHILVTCLPAQMQSLALDPHFGLASDQLEGRAKATALVRRALKEIARLKAERPDLKIHAIELHSGPRPQGDVRSSAASLKKSLHELLSSEEWPADLGLYLEHCDRYIEEQAPAKGFLALEDELKVLGELAGSHGARVGCMLNWGRSAIEGRSAELPLEHFKKAQASGFLRGMIFSGASAAHPLFGEWSDSHAPIAEAENDENLLLTRAKIREIAAQAKGDVFWGLKIQALPKDLGIPERLGFLRRNLEVLGQACQGK